MLLFSNERMSTRTPAGYLYVDCLGQGQFKAGRYFAGQGANEYTHPLRERAVKHRYKRQTLHGQARRGS